jgi:hypothetical protein
MGTTKCPPYLHTDFVLSHFGSTRRKAQEKYEKFVMDGIDMESPLKEAKNQIFLGSDSFVQEMMRQVEDGDTLQNLPRAQKLAGKPALEELFSGKAMKSKRNRNEQIKAAFETHQYSLREIGDYLGLNPNYLSRLLGDMRKK